MIRLFTLTWCGRTWRLASRAVDIPSNVGLLRYDGGLPELEIRRSLDLLGDSAPLDVSTEIILPVAVAPLVRDGHRLEGAQVEIADYDGGDFETRTLHLQGRVQSADFGRDGSPIKIKVSSDESDDSAIYPPSSYLIDADGWATFGAGTWDVNFDGRPYPVPFGQPGDLLKNGVVTVSPGSPAYVVDVSGAGALTVLVGGVPADVAGGGTLTILDVTAGERAAVPWITSAAIAPVVVTDGRGQRVTVVVLPPADAVSVAWAAGDVLYCCWGSLAGQRWRGGPLTAAGDVLRWALTLSSLRVDWRRAEPVCQAIRWLLDGYWDRQVAPWDWVKSNLLPILPVSIVRGPGGLYPILWRWLAVEKDASYHFVDALNCRIGEPEIRDADNSVDSVTISFQKSASKGEYRASYLLSADRPSGRLQGQSMRSRIRRQTTSEPRTHEVESEVIQAETTAMRAARGLLAALAAREVYPVTADSRAAEIDLGAVVTLTGTDYGLSRRLGSVVATSRSSDRVTLEVALHSAIG